MRKKTTLAIIFSTVLILGIKASYAEAATYYVSNSGNDTNSGTSESQSWKSIDKVNKSTFQPGDNILLKRGDIWREQLTVPSSGTEGHLITFGAYGSGNDPVISGADDFTGASWSNQGSNIWRISLSQHAEVAIFDNNHLGNYTISPAAKYDFYWSGGYLYVYATSNPNGYYTKIEAGQRSSAIDTNRKNYLTIDSIDTYGGQINDSITLADPGGNICVNRSSNVTIQNTNSGYAEQAAIYLRGASYVTVQNNTIHDVIRGAYNPADGIVLNPYEAGSVRVRPHYPIQ